MFFFFLLLSPLLNFSVSFTSMGLQVVQSPVVLSCWSYAGEQTLYSARLVLRDERWGRKEKKEREKELQSGSEWLDAGHTVRDDGQTRGLQVLNKKKVKIILPVFHIGVQTGWIRQYCNRSVSTEFKWCLRDHILGQVSPKHRGTKIIFFFTSSQRTHSGFGVFLGGNSLCKNQIHNKT